MMPTLIETQNLCYEYKHENEITIALKNINISIDEGEFVVIIGHNGSGKSTLAKHLNALFLPSKGDVWIKGMNTRNEEQLWSIRQQVGMVFQNPDNQLVATIVEEDVAFGPENLGVPSNEIVKRVEDSLKAVNMLQYRRHAPHHLSGGQKQRIAIAGVLAMLPSCIVLDEPTAMLDPLGRKEVMDTIIDLNKSKGMTVIHVTHHMEEAIEADRIIVMAAGEVVQEGTPKTIFSQVNELKQLGLDVPQMTELAFALKQQGIHVPEGVLSLEEMVNCLCP